MATKRTTKANRNRGGSTALKVGAGVALAGVAALVGIFARRRASGVTPSGAEHPAPDLAPDAPRPGTNGTRAPEAFRPDPTAPVPENERESLRPATHKPTMTG